MKKTLFFIPIVFFYCFTSAQKVDSIYFHLYTDSLKKSVYNYINVDGKMPNGRYIPLDSKEVKFSSSYGVWDGNSLIIDSNYKKDSVVVTAFLIEKPALKQTITIYIKKKNTDEVLPTEEEIMRPKRKRNR